MTHTHSGDGTVPGLHGEPIPTPVLGCPACATVRSIGGELGAAPEDPPVCRHCGYFIRYEVPKAPAEPFWAHTGYSPTPPAGPSCDHAQPKS